jgi:hypothetical protein
MFTRQKLLNLVTLVRHYKNESTMEEMLEPIHKQIEMSNVTWQ